MLAIIPARGGSKRIPRKNIKPFLDKPIIAYSIEAALKSTLFETVMVSTDDLEIAEIAKQYGAEVPFLRSESNANDFATTVDVLLEVLAKYKNYYKVFEYACCIYPTAPFVTASLLSNAFDLMKNQNFDTVFPVLPFSFPIQRAVKLDNKKMSMFHPEYLNTRSQDLEKAYHDCGQFYWFKPNLITKQKELWTDNTGVVVLPELEAHDIDEPNDWEIAEFKYKMRLNAKT